MKNSRLRAALIMGTIALVWSIPSLNIFGIVAFIMSWTAYSSNKKGSAYAAMGFYIAATVLSLFFSKLLLAAGGIFGAAALAAGLSESAVPTVLTGIAVFSFVIDALYIIAAVKCFKAGKELPESGKGFFD